MRAFCRSLVPVASVCDTVGFRDTANSSRGYLHYDYWYLFKGRWLNIDLMICWCFLSNPRQRRHRGVMKSAGDVKWDHEPEDQKIRAYAFE